MKQIKFYYKCQKKKSKIKKKFNQIVNLVLNKYNLLKNSRFYSIKRFLIDKVKVNYSNKMNIIMMILKLKIFKNKKLILKLKSYRLRF